MVSYNLQGAYSVEFVFRIIRRTEQFKNYDILFGSNNWGLLVIYDGEVELEQQVKWYTWSQLMRLIID